MRSLLTSLSLSLLALPLTVFASAPSEVTGLTGTPVAGGAIDLTWDEATDADGVVIGYKLYYGTTPVVEVDDVYANTLDISLVTAYTLEGLTEGETYHLALTAIDESENESETYSKEISVTLDPNQYTDKVTGPAVVAASHEEETKLLITFDQDIQVKSPKDAFVITEKSSGKAVAIRTTRANGDTAEITLTPNALTTGQTYTVTATTAVQSADGTPVSSGLTDNIEFTAADFTPAEPEPEVDTQAPKDVSGLKVNQANFATDGTVTLQWNAPTDNDLAGIMLYVKEGSNAWEPGVDLGPKSTEADIEVTAGQNYEMKITTFDTAKNESNGQSVSFTVEKAEEKVEAPEEKPAEEPKEEKKETPVETTKEEPKMDTQDHTDTNDIAEMKTVTDTAAGQGDLSATGPTAYIPFLATLALASWLGYRRRTMVMTF